MTLRLGQSVPGPHGRAEVLTTGILLADARAAMVLCHGRGASARDILGLADHFETPETLFVAPQAEEHSWYPRSFLAPLRENEPYLSSALALLGAIVAQLEREGIAPHRQLVLGFSQGGCLALEFVGRNARRYGGVAGLSAGLIGPPGRSWDFPTSLAGTPVFLGCSDRDPHIPRERLEESARELARVGAAVELQIYPGLGHTINLDELERVQRMLEQIDRAPAVS